MESRLRPDFAIVLTNGGNLGCAQLSSSLSKLFHCSATVIKNMLVIRSRLVMLSNVRNAESADRDFIDVSSFSGLPSI